MMSHFLSNWLTVTPFCCYACISTTQHTAHPLDLQALSHLLDSSTVCTYVCAPEPPPTRCRMVPHLCLAVTKVGCLKHLAQQQICCQHVAPGNTTTTAGRVEPACIGDILDRIMNIVVVTTNQHQMVRCVHSFMLVMHCSAIPHRMAPHTHMLSPQVCSAPVCYATTH